MLAAFTTLAVIRRRDLPAHKRYILFASIVMRQAAVARWPFDIVAADSRVPRGNGPAVAV